MKRSSCKPGQRSGLSASLRSLPLFLSCLFQKGQSRVLHSSKKNQELLWNQNTQNCRKSLSTGTATVVSMHTQLCFPEVVPETRDPYIKGYLPVVKSHHGCSPKHLQFLQISSPTVFGLCRYSEEKLGLLCSAGIHILHPKRKQAEDTWLISSLNPLCF